MKGQPSPLPGTPLPWDPLPHTPLLCASFILLNSRKTYDLWIEFGKHRKIKGKKYAMTQSPTVWRSIAYISIFCFDLFFFHVKMLLLLPVPAWLCLVSSHTFYRFQVYVFFLWEASPDLSTVYLLTPP